MVEEVKKYTFVDFLLAEGVVIIGLAEVVHLAGLFLGWPFSRCALVWGILLLVVLVAGAVGAAVAGFKGRKSVGTDSVSGRSGRLKAPERSGSLNTVWILYGLFGLVLLSQILFLLFGDVVYRQGDMTVETVGSFLATDGIYRVNPMTGQPYTAGIPLRLEILCLPTLYGSICSLTGLEPVFVVQTLTPIFVLLAGYLAFYMLGRSLFGEDAKRKACFLLVVSLLVWAGTYLYGMDGFNLLCSGFRGVTLRNGVLIPWAFSLCLRKKKLGAILCILGEACICWTFYGMGMCLLVVVGTTVTQAVSARFLENGADTGRREEA